MKGGGPEAVKRRAGEHAAAVVNDGMIVGLGTGSTAAHAIRSLGRRVDSGLDIVGVPTSYQSRSLASEVGIPLGTLTETTPDIAIDGADQIAGGNCIKGGGGAHAREKLVDVAADRLLIVADASKESQRLDMPIPVEVLPDARTTVADAVEQMGGEPTLRAAKRKDGPVVTDNGNLLLDCAFGSIDDAATLATQLATLPGVVEHGLFVGEADEFHIGDENGVTVRRD